MTKRLKVLFSMTYHFFLHLFLLSSHSKLGVFLSDLHQCCKDHWLNNVPLYCWAHRLSHMDFEMGEHVLQEMLEAAISEVRPACQGKGIRVSTDLAEKFRKQRLNNPNLMQVLQNVLFDFLFASVKFCPIGGSIVISCNQTMKIGENISTMDLELRYTSHALYCTHTTFS